MLKLTLEIIPHGDEDQKKEISTIYIANVLTDEDNTANYDVWDEKGNESAVLGHRRGRPNGYWRLARKAIMEILKVREGK